MDKTEPQESQAATPEKRELPANTGNVGSPVYTDEQVKEFVNKAVRDALTSAGRDEAARKRAGIELEEARADLERQRRDWQRQQEEAEEMAAADDPEALKALRRERQARAALQDAEAKLKEAKRKEQELASAISEAQQLKRDKMIQDIASRYGLEFNDLVEYADLPRERLEMLAQRLPKSTTAPKIRTDSGTRGGANTWEDIRAAYIKNPEDPHVRATYLKMRRER